MSAPTVRRAFGMLLAAAVAAICYHLGYSDGFDSGRTRF